MIKHIVFFKLSQDGINHKDEIVQKLTNLKNDIDFIVDLEVGINFAPEDRACDLSLIVVLNTKEDLEAYAIHDKHIPVVQFIKQYAVESKVVDYEI
ncbi:MAG: Dabb family protein [Campylobacterales bacterium]|nr:Dabb family protein [Campylobacterales bacterium]